MVMTKATKMRMGQSLIFLCLALKRKRCRASCMVPPNKPELLRRGHSILSPRVTPQTPRESASDSAIWMVIELR
jgi:hypothetical protein